MTDKKRNTYSSISCSECNDEIASALCADEWYWNKGEPFCEFCYKADFSYLKEEVDLRWRKN